MTDPRRLQAWAVVCGLSSRIECGSPGRTQLRVYGLDEYGFLAGTAVTGWNRLLLHHYDGVDGRRVLLSRDYAAAAPPEEVASHAGEHQDRRPSNHHRRPARDRGGSEGRSSSSAGSSGQPAARSDQGFGGAIDHGG